MFLQRKHESTVPAETRLPGRVRRYKFNTVAPFGLFVFVCVSASLARFPLAFTLFRFFGCDMWAPTANNQFQIGSHVFTVEFHTYFYHLLDALPGIWVLFSIHLVPRLNAASRL